jgi:hypothetical protein
MADGVTWMDQMLAEQEKKRQAGKTKRDPGRILTDWEKQRAEGIPIPTGGSAAPVKQSGVDLARQMINAGYGSSLAEYGFTPDDVIAELGNQGVDLTKKGLKAADIIAGLNAAGLESDFKYKMTHKAPTPPLSGAAANQLLSSIANYQRPFLDNMKAEANYAGSLVGDLAKYLSPRSAAAYGDLTKGYVGQANVLANLIPAENASILTQLASGAAPKAMGANSSLGPLFAASGFKAP